MLDGQSQRTASGVRRSHHVDSTLVSKVKIKAMRMMRAGQTDRLGGYGTKHETQAGIDASFYAPEFSASASKPMPTMVNKRERREDNICAPGWFGVSRSRDPSVRRNGGWNSSTRVDKPFRTQSNRRPQSAPHVRRFDDDYYDSDCSDERGRCGDRDGTRSPRSPRSPRPGYRSPEDRYERRLRSSDWGLSDDDDDFDDSPDRFRYDYAVQDDRDEDFKRDDGGLWNADFTRIGMRLKQQYGNNRMAF